MKKLILALLAVASVGTANAQKNTFLTYGNAGVMWDKTDNGNLVGSTENTTWNITPGVGYQFNNHLTVGVQGGYGQNKTINNTVGAPSIQNTMNNREWQLGAFFRYTQPLGGIFSMWTQLDLSYLSGKWSSEVITYGPATTVANSSDMYNGFQGSITPAIALAVHKGWALNFGIGGLAYRTTSYDKAPTVTNGFMVTFGQQFNVGVSRNIGCCMSKHRAHHEPGMEHRKMKKHDDDDDE
ncbi:MAG: porin family protein [Bacteroidetes bacterium]|nr:porin family protein [Bacteroidota bacterium]